MLQAKVPEAELILFGSRAGETARPDSDYDYVIIVPDSSGTMERKMLASSIRKKLAEHDVDADVIVQTRSKFEDLRQFPGNVFRWADKEGVAV